MVRGLLMVRAASPSLVGGLKYKPSPSVSTQDINTDQVRAVGDEDGVAKSGWGLKLKEQKNKGEPIGGARWGFRYKSNVPTAR